MAYKAKKGRETKTFDVCEWLAAMCPDIPNRGEQMVRFYSYYSNVCRGKRRQKNQDDSIACIIEAVPASSAKRKSWARLIRKIYEVVPLTCPQCKVVMKIISFTKQTEVIKQALQHLGLWKTQKQPPLRINSPPPDYCAAE